ncbi:GNAT family N-acetyltransferase [Paenibacillus sp. J2TS4]|uniref:GNAT family N-acetyltransferase n=1 Tax=Paenibacillus sp. J2TS4 TaxID=2807194 RepID=UPI001B04D858|nr:GNAT family N-acetyltransferase [Paenibacillus sp. J2TS4]GIP31012.1 GNAT family acetyltransferase [Paenibacillus sp. J2TS4]
MSKYPLISDYRQIEKYRESFNELAKQVFEIDFKEWHDKGFWSDHYICYSYVDGDQVIANASVNKMVLMCNGKEYKAIQLGTVMTHPDYRHQGLAAKLMNHIIEKYEKDYDFIYLFANDTVLDFYPKFGFEKVQESSFTLTVSDLKQQAVRKSALRKLDVDNQDDFELMKEFAAERIPISSTFGVKDGEQLLMFYFIVVFRNAIYHDEDEDAILLFKQEENHLHVFDIISKRKINLEAVVDHMISDETEFVHFYFVPDSDNENIQSALITESDDTLFVRPLLIDGTKHFRFPFTSHA